MGSQSSAKRFVQEALAYDPDLSTAHLMLASIAKDERDYELALEAVNKALKAEPEWTEARLTRAIVLSYIGRDEDAALDLRAVLKAHPKNVNALSLLISLPIEAGDKTLARTILASGILDEQTGLTAISQTFFTANVHKRLGHGDTAWRFFLAGNEQMQPQTAEGALKVRTWQQESLVLLKNRGTPRFPDDAALPISLFILGASRSGKTTIESVLAASPAIQHGYESPHIKDALTHAYAAAGFVPTAQLDLLPEKLYQAFRERYFAALNDRLKGASIYTNTSPLHIHNAWSLADILPNARFIFVTRDPIETAVRIFQTHYSSANHYAYTAQSALEHVHWYADMIAACMDRFGDRAIHVDYARFTQDPKVYRQAFEALLCLKMPFESSLSIANDSAETNAYRSLFEALL